MSASGSCFPACSVAHLDPLCHSRSVPYEWEEAKTIDPAVYQQLAKDGLLVPLVFGHRVPKKYAQKDGTVFGGVKAEEWDGL